jgi:hypothetical protein
MKMEGRQILMNKKGERPSFTSIMIIAMKNLLKCMLEKLRRLSRMRSGLDEVIEQQKTSANSSQKM